MFHILSAKENRINDDISNQNNRWDSDAVYSSLVQFVSEAKADENKDVTTADLELADAVLAASKSKIVSTKLCSGLLNQPKWLPLRYAPV